MQESTQNASSLTAQQENNIAQNLMDHHFVYCFVYTFSRVKTCVKIICAPAKCRTKTTTVLNTSG